MPAQAKPRPLSGTVALAQTIMDAERTATQDLGIDFTQVDIDWDYDEIEVTKMVKGVEEKTTKQTNFRPRVVAIHGTDDDGQIESWTPAKIDRVMKRKSANVTQIKSA